MARKAAAVAQALKEAAKDPGLAPAPTELSVRPALEDDLRALADAKAITEIPEPPGPLYDVDSLLKLEREELLSKFQRRFAKIEMPMAKAGARARFCVVPAGYDPLILEVAKSRGYAVLVGDPETPDLGFSLHADRPRGAAPFVDGSSGPQPQRPALKITAPRAAVKMDGIPVDYVAFVQPVSLLPTSSSVEADRHLSVNAKTRTNETVQMALKGGTLHVLVLGKNPRFVFIPITNCVKVHPSAAWAAEEMGRLEPLVRAGGPAE